MSQIILNGYVLGFQKNTVSKYLQEEAGLSWREASHCLKQCLQGKCTIIEIPDQRKARQIAYGLSLLEAKLELRE